MRVSHGSLRHRGLQKSAAASSKNQCARGFRRGSGHTFPIIQLQEQRYTYIHIYICICIYIYIRIYIYISLSLSLSLFVACPTLWTSVCARALPTQDGVCALLSAVHDPACRLRGMIRAEKSNPSSCRTFGPTVIPLKTEYPPARNNKYTHMYLRVSGCLVLGGRDS